MGIEPDLTTVVFDVELGVIETETGTGLDILGGEEGIKDFFAMFLRNAAAVVADDNLSSGTRSLPRGTTGFGHDGVPFADTAQAYFHFTSSADGVASVDAEIEDGLSETAFLDECGERTPFVVYFETAAARNDYLDEIDLIPE